MDAVVLKRYGGPESLQLTEHPDPPGLSGWVTVRLRAAAVNWHDTLVRQGRYGSPLPHVPGADGAGVRTDTGEEVLVLPSLFWGQDERAPGPAWEILGDRRPGTYAELVSVPSSCLFPRPSGLSWEEAAAVPLVGVTVYRALFTRARLRAGESLLVLGAGGGVATAAVALAAAAGARVFVTSSSAEKIERSRDLGAVGGVSYTAPDWPARARELLRPSAEGFDVVLDGVGKWDESLKALRPGGRLIVLGASRSEAVSLSVRPFYFAQYDLLGTTMGSRQDFVQLLDFMASSGAPAPVIDRVFPLDRASDAHEHIETGQAFGKIILKISDGGT